MNARANTNHAPAVSVVIPVYNEEGNLKALWDELKPVLDGLGAPCEAVFVDDGSSDRSPEILADLHARNPEVTVVRFARNFGQQMANTAGLRFARGKAVIIMDADLQTPAEHIPEFLAKLREGCDIVYGVRERIPGPLYRRIGTRIANRFICAMTGFEIPDSASGFLALDRALVERVNRYNDRSRYLSGLFAWLSYGRYGAIPVTRRQRFSGESKYTFHQLVRIVLTFVYSFSVRPLRLILAAGAAVLALSAAAFAWAGAVHLGLAPGASGPAWLTAGMLTIAGFQLSALGAAGVYTAEVYAGVRERPSYVIWEALGWDGTP